MTKRLELPKFQAFDSNGDPLSGGKVYTYEPGTTTLKTSYSDYDASTANANPVVLDSRGEADIYVNGTYKISVYTSADVLVWTLDNVQGGAGSDDVVGEDYYYPEATATDQGATGNSDTIKYAVDTISSDEASIYLRHDGGGSSTTYTLTTSESIPSNVSLIIEPGAIIDGAGTLTLDNPEQIDSQQVQIFGSSITITFTGRGKVYPEWWGADISAASDAATEVSAAVTSLTTSGGILSCVGKSLRIDSTIDLVSDLTIEGGTFDFSNATTSDIMFDALGTQGTAQSITSNVSQGDEQIPVASAGTYFTANDWTILRDTDQWAPYTPSICGEWVYILSVDAAAINTGADLLYGYTTTDTGVLDVFTFKENIVLKDITATGGGSSKNHTFFRAKYAKNITVNGCNLSDFENRSIRMDHVAIFSIRNNQIFRSNDTSTGYGVSVIASVDGFVKNNYIEECRHGVSVGGDSIPTRFVIIDKNIVQSPTDAGLDSHPASDYLTFSNNVVHGGETSGVTADGIICQGANAKIVNNQINNPEQHGILVQNMQSSGALSFSTYKIEGNRIVRPGEIGIYVEQNFSGDLPLKGVQILNNNIISPGDDGIFIYARFADIDQLNISNNHVSGVTGASIYSLWIYALTGMACTGGIVSGNVFERTDDLASNVRIQGADATSITYYSIIGNYVKEGTYGIRGINDDYFSAVGNVIQSVTDGVNLAGVNSYDDTSSNLES